MLGLEEPTAELEDLAAAVTELATSVGVDASGVADTIDALLERRQQARADREFDVADRIRDGLADMQLTLEDRPGGTIWRRE